MGGTGLPTLLLAVQLGVGLLAAVDLIQSVSRNRRVGPAQVGEAILVVVLVTLGADGLFLGVDPIGRIAYELDLEPSLVRPITIGLIVVGSLLWLTDRTPD